MNNKIIVERETFESKGKTYYTYFIKGQVRGKDVRVAVIPPDKGGYAVLDIVFGDAMEAELVAKPFEIRDDKTKRVVRGNTYAVRTVEDNGTIYECAIKPAKPSDKSLLEMLMR